MAYYDNWKGTERPLKMHVLSVGSGNMVLLAFPNGNFLLSDCNVTEDTKDEILGYLRHVIPPRKYPGETEARRWIHIFANSHRDDDHLHGLDLVNEGFPIRSIWDSGRTGDSTEAADYEYYMRLCRKLKEKYGEDAVRVPAPSHAPFQREGEAVIYCLNSSAWEDEFSTTHEAMLVLKVNYGGRTILLPGDSDYLAWKNRILPGFRNEVASEILIASHHGSRSFFMEVVPDQEYSRNDFWTDHLKAINPNVVLISVDDGSKYGHPDPEALKEYKDQAPSHVFTTNDCGHLVGVFYDNGRYTICPSRFKRHDMGAKAIRIAAQLLDNNGADAGTLASGCDVPLASKVLFTAIPQGGLMTDARKMKYEFEVSNGGVDGDHTHQEIYFKGKDEPQAANQFKREVSFLGRHLLRCTAWCGTNPAIKATDVFVVNGV